MNDIQNLFGKTNSRMNARIVDMASILIAKNRCRMSVSNFNKLQRPITSDDHAPSASLQAVVYAELSVYCCCGS